MASGLPPFYHQNPMKTYEKILNGQYTCPSHFTDRLKSFESYLLVVDRTKRFQRQLRAHTTISKNSFAVLVKLF